MPSNFMLGGVGMGGPCDFSVSPSSVGLDFGTLDFGLDKNLTYVTSVGVKLGGRGETPTLPNYELV